MLSPGSIQTREPQYARCWEAPPRELGPMTGATYRWNPKRLAFVLARYKWVAHMLRGKGLVAEIGCGDAFASALVRQEVGELHLHDFDPLFVDWARREYEHVQQWDIAEGPLPSLMRYEAVYMIDVLEHIAPADEPKVIDHICKSLAPIGGVFIAGVPSLEAQPFSSEQSKMGHVNCRNGGVLKQDMLRYFDNVFLFSVNDEMVHTGFTPLAHYLFALCVGPRRRTFGRATLDNPVSLQDEAELSSLIARLAPLRPQSYLEIGARYGGTFRRIMEGLPGMRGVAVDLPGGPWGEAGSKDILSKVCADVGATCIFGSSQDRHVIDAVWDQGPFDIVFIDGDHSYEGVKRDWENYHSCASVVVLHDIAAPEGWRNSAGQAVEVPHFWRELQDQYRTESIITPGSNMGIGIVYLDPLPGWVSR